MTGIIPKFEEEYCDAYQQKCGYNIGDHGIGSNVTLANRKINCCQKDEPKEEGAQ